MKRKEKGIAVAFCAIAILVAPPLTSHLHAYTSTTCPGANPFDNASDTEALNDCLAEYDVVALEPSDQEGYIGYIIANDPSSSTARYWGNTSSGVLINSDNVLTKNGSGDWPILIADADLTAPLIAAHTESETDYVLDQLIIDGNKANRTAASSCSGYRGPYSNVLLRGSGFSVTAVASRDALCGSSMEIAGSDYTISSSYFGNNGYDSGSGEPWSDGLTVLESHDAHISYNQFSDNTDVDLVVFPGSTDLWIDHNSISHSGQHGFAGLQASQDSGTYGQIYLNTITSDEDMLAMGAMLGQHPWAPMATNLDVGQFYDNDIEGAVINLVIDGISDGDVYDNYISGHQGTWGFGGCTASYDYTAAHYGSASIQSGATSFYVHGGSGCGTP